MCDMAADAFIQCRVTPEMKEAIRSLARREQISESALLKQLLSVVLRTAGSSVRLAEDRQTDRMRDSRLSVRLRMEDRALLAERCAARGLACATYVSVLIRAHLRKVAPMPREELLALKRLTSELGAIGRSVNELARRANSRADSLTPAHVTATLQLVTALRDHVKALILANQKSWEDGYAP